MMKALLTVLILFAVAGCATGIDPIDAIINPPKTCNVDVQVQNSSSTTLTLKAWATATSDSRCSPYMTDEKSVSVEPGKSGAVHLEMKCRMCGTHSVPSVTNGTSNIDVNYELQPNLTIVCTDTACVEQK